ncbi:fluoride efflux transporter CrcB [Nocardia otitidiscaviarum]|nr:fluoride efflux transporter CrcB [Nocardia otitidiscaviarum]MBF6132197.1 fluoride efflux transporter CrcB [Nocardia otitidiscaviarum]MBF6236880.1 fluoride efflux transporter CrcB [Nocardia otitidiscaviarum]MBF6483327.1 fluoride efflux transporter CrcB [Nocardia otitidiscaviarum]
MTMLLVALGGMVGAPVRYLADRAMARRFASVFPLGTLTVNVTGSAILGALIGAGANHWLLAVAGTGFCGALTTFSTFGYETVRLAEEGAYSYAVANVVIGVVASLAAAFLGAGAAQFFLGAAHGGLP